MRHLALLLCLSCSVLLIATAANPQQPAQEPISTSGLAMLKDCSAELEGLNVTPKTVDDLIRGLNGANCAGRVLGFSDGYFEGQLHAGGRLDYCPPGGMTTEQLVRVVVKYLSDHPAELHEHWSGLTRTALIQAFPCRSTR